LSIDLVADERFGWVTGRLEPRDKNRLRRLSNFERRTRKTGLILNLRARGSYQPRRSLLEVTKRVDTLVVLLVAVLTVFGTGAVYAALHFEWFGSPWQLAAWLLVCVAFLAAGVPAVGHRMTRHTNVHGSARAASQDEARKAARGDTGASPMHDQTFED
jgi:hypothetical protein